MQGIKNLFASKTILTTALGAVFTLLSLLGVIDVTAATQEIVVTALFAAAGYFRFIATDQLVVTTT